MKCPSCRSSIIRKGKRACAWFDDKIYYAFDPLEAKITFSKATHSVSRVGNGFRKGFSFGWRGLSTE